MTIYTEAHPTQAPHLLKYLSLVESIAEDNGEWQLYDETFRYERASLADKSKKPWQAMDEELYTIAMIKPLTQGQVPINNSNIRSLLQSQIQGSSNNELLRAITQAASAQVSTSSSGEAGDPVFPAFSHSEGTVGQSFLQQGPVQNLFPPAPVSTTRSSQPANSRTPKNDLRSDNTRRGKSKYKYGTCWQFQDGNYCDKQCGWNHSCEVCSGPHATRYCNQPSSHSTNTNDNNRSKYPPRTHSRT
jgi:hypothetical protein